MSLTSELKAFARGLGFELVGVAAPQRAPGWDRFAQWLGQGFAGAMDYLHHGSAARANPEAILPGVRSLVVLGLSYHQPDARQQPTPPLQGRVATYALGADYHEVLWRKLDRLRDWLGEQVPECASRGVVDTAPLLERDYARLAGLGWFGKNTMLINKRLGSFFFVATLLTTAELQVDAPHQASHCGTCTACLDACPTQAFPAPGVLDAQKCISYLTIELRQPIPAEYRAALNDWVFGCDICQDVCPWNRKAPAGNDQELTAGQRAPFLDLPALFELSPDEFRRRFKASALWRAKRRGLLRNAALLLGQSQDPRAVPALLRGLVDEEPLVRAAAAWALRHFARPEVRGALQQRLTVESDAAVRAEVQGALDSLEPGGA